MKVRNFEHFIAELGTLSKRQREKVLTLLNQVSQQEKVIEEIERAAAANLGCPRCRSTQCIKWTHRSRQFFSEFKLCPLPTLQLVGAAP